MKRIIIGIVISVACVGTIVFSIIKGYVKDKFDEYIDKYHNCYEIDSNPYELELDLNELGKSFKHVRREDTINYNIQKKKPDNNVMW